MEEEERKESGDESGQDSEVRLTLLVVGGKVSSFHPVSSVSSSFDYLGFPDRL